MIVLGLESSCDEMAAAVLADRTVRSSVVRSQVDLHAAYGGIVPEIASRDHALHVGFVIEEALEKAKVTPSMLDGVAVTSGPGLIGSLLAGVEAAKGLAVAARKPLIGVHHLEGHIASALLEDPAPEPPFVALIVSGGHTSIVLVPELGGPYEVIGQTRDDAAGEAFDKTAKSLGLGYPGGVEIDRLSQTGDPTAFGFPDVMPGRDNFAFSFSGLKTAALRLLERETLPLTGQRLADFCASFQDAVVENLLGKALRATRRSQTGRLIIVGGVAANQRLRERALEKSKGHQVQVYLPSRANCTDNAAMIACAGMVRLARGERSPVGLAARAHWPLQDLGRS